MHFESAGITVPELLLSDFHASRIRCLFANCLSLYMYIFKGLRPPAAGPLPSNVGKSVTGDRRLVTADWWLQACVSRTRTICIFVCLSRMCFRSF